MSPPDGELVTEIVDWGTREYTSALAGMRELRAARRRGAIPDTLVLVEHPPVVTVGVQGDDGESLPDGIPVVRVERGGKGTYHGPGQLVGYPIVDLEPRGRDVRRFVRDVEGLVIEAVRSRGVDAGRVAERRGVWVEGERKIASIGVAVEAWVTFHGFALNVATDLGAFRSFHPCGMDGSVMTSVAAELGEPVTVEEMKPAIVEAWERLFGTRAAPPPARTGSIGPSDTAVPVS
ncbi:MAG: lipoyl(octanoyl) transferase LipB [Thermoplasmata archaeon]|nr:lipoyl(octanoyl) transferase LipB [Thermoplasmata archaeon]